MASHSPAVVKLGKQFFYDQVEKGIADAYALASEGMACNMMLEDAAEGIDAFIGKTPAGLEEPLAVSASAARARPSPP